MCFIIFNYSNFDGFLSVNRIFDIYTEQGYVVSLNVIVSLNWKNYKIPIKQ